MKATSTMYFKRGLIHHDLTITLESHGPIALAEFDEAFAAARSAIIESREAKQWLFEHGTTEHSEIPKRPLE